MYDILIIGSGPAGLTAAIYAARANKKTIVIEGNSPCGQLTTTSYVENYPGFESPVLGNDLMDAMYNQAKNCGTVLKSESVVSFKKVKDIFEVQLIKEMITTKAVIICTGSSPKMLGIEKNLIGRGLSTCATCDGTFFKNKIVAVIGGGNSALEEALYLSKLAQIVYLIHRRNEFRGEYIMQERIKKQENIKILTPYTVKEFIGEQKLEQIHLENVKDKSSKIIDVNGTFIAIGHTPNTSFIQNSVELTKDRYIKNGPITEVEGLFAAGDVYDSKYRQAITSAGQGCIAALEAIKYLENNLNF